MLAKVEQNLINDKLDNFLSTFRMLSADNLAVLPFIYDREVVFEDPVCQHHGIDNMSKYFKKL